MTDVRATLRQTVLPQVFGVLADAGIFEKVTVTRTAQTSDGAGGYTAGAVTTPYTNVPMVFEIDKVGKRFDTSGKLVATQTYIATFAPYFSGSKLAIVLATDKFTVTREGDTVTFRIICPAEEIAEAYVVAIEQ